MPISTSKTSPANETPPFPRVRAASRRLAHHWARRQGRHAQPETSSQIENRGLARFSI